MNIPNNVGQPWAQIHEIQFVVANRVPADHDEADEEENDNVRQRWANAQANVLRVADMIDRGYFIAPVIMNGRRLNEDAE